MNLKCVKYTLLFHDGGSYYVETSPLIGSANQWTSFYMIEAFVMKELKQSSYLAIINFFLTFGTHWNDQWSWNSYFLQINLFYTAQKIKFFIWDFFSKSDQIRRKLRIWSHLLKKFLTEKFIFSAVSSTVVRLKPFEPIWKMQYITFSSRCNTGKFYT